MHAKFLTNCMKRKWYMKEEGVLFCLSLHLTDPLLGAKILERS